MPISAHCNSKWTLELGTYLDLAMLPMVYKVLKGHPILMWMWSLLVLRRGFWHGPVMQL